MKILESCKDRKPDKEMVEEIIKIQGLVQEIRSNVS
jgi:histidinol phosphatase-like enzyme